MPDSADPEVGTTASGTRIFTIWRSIMTNWWIGCSGFYYKHWREVFYPKGLAQRNWFEFYCEFFNTVELNVTFYRYPKLDALKGWYSRSPDAFRFTVKAPRLITHYKKFHNALREARDFYDLVGNGLAEKLGCVLFQLPANLVYTDSNLENVLATLDSAFHNVIEFRHESWWNENVYRALEENNITFCSISFPSLPDAIIPSSPVTYYRFHGVPQLYASSYSIEKLEQMAGDLRLLRGVEDVYCYFNNDIFAEAVKNAVELALLLQDSPPAGASDAPAV